MGRITAACEAYSAFQPASGTLAAEVKNGLMTASMIVSPPVQYIQHCAVADFVWTTVAIAATRRKAAAVIKYLRNRPSLF